MAAAAFLGRSCSPRTWAPLLIGGPATVQLINNGLAGPAISIPLSAAAPVLFQADATTVLATHGNGPVVTKTQPAQRGEVIVLYATVLVPLPRQLSPIRSRRSRRPLPIRRIPSGVERHGRRSQAGVVRGRDAGVRRSVSNQPSAPRRPASQPGDPHWLWQPTEPSRAHTSLAVNSVGHAFSLSKEAHEGSCSRRHFERSSGAFTS